MKIKGNVVLVTGGASGLGQACVEYIAMAGGKVVILDLADKAGEALQRALGADNALFVKTDITSEESVNAALDAAVAKFGAVHGVINCAGIAASMRIVARNGAHPLSVFEKVVKINLVGTFNVMRLCAERIAKQQPVTEDGERGVIINVASVAAFDGQIGQAAYSASKGGVVAMALPAARELGPTAGIRVNTVAPGVIQTPMLASLPEKAQESLKKQVCFPRRLGLSVEFAKLCADILENGYINGEVIRLDAGIRMAAM